MRILCLAPHPFYQARGTPIAVRLLLEALSLRGHQVDVLTYPEGQDVVIPGVRIFRTPRPPGVRRIPPGFSWKKLALDGPMFLRAMALAATGRYHLVHAMEEAAFMARALRAAHGLPYVYDMDSSLPEQMQERFPALGRAAPLLRRLEAWAVRGSRGVVAVCPALEEVARGCAERVGVCRLEDISLLEVPWASDGETPPALEMGRPRFMYVGNLEPYQGAGLMLEAFALARREVPAAQLVVIGGAPEQIMRLETRTRELGCQEAAHFLGPRPPAQLGGYLAQADILLSPRITGRNTPMKIYSYLDSGKPLIATDIASHTQVLDPSQALMVPPRPREMAAAMARLAREPELGRALARNARKLVAREHCLDAFRDKLGRFYAELEKELGE